MWILVKGVNPVQIEFTVHLFAARDALLSFLLPAVELFVELHATEVFGFPFLTRENV